MFAIFINLLSCVQDQWQSQGAKALGTATTTAPPFQSVGAVPWSVTVQDLIKRRQAE